MTDLERDPLLPPYTHVNEEEPDDGTLNVTAPPYPSDKVSFYYYPEKDACRARMPSLLPPSFLSKTHPHILYLLTIPQTSPPILRFIHRLPSYCYRCSRGEGPRMWICPFCYRYPVHRFTNFLCVECQSLEAHQLTGRRWMFDAFVDALPPFLLPTVLIQEILSYLDEVCVPMPPENKSLNYFYWAKSPALPARCARGKSGILLYWTSCIMAILYLFLCIVGVLDLSTWNGMWCNVTGSFGLLFHYTIPMLTNWLYNRWHGIPAFETRLEILHCVSGPYVILAHLVIPLLLVVIGWVLTIQGLPVVRSTKGEILSYYLVGIGSLGVAPSLCILNTIACGVRRWTNVMERRCRCTAWRCTGRCMNDA